jgi:hypothetical protein
MSNDSFKFSSLITVNYADFAWILIGFDTFCSWGSKVQIDFDGVDDFSNCLGDYSKF